MKITLLNSLISVLVAGWCVFGVVVHGWQILFYPLAWLGIASGFFALNFFHNRKLAAATEAEGKSDKADSKQPVIESQEKTAMGA